MRFDLGSIGLAHRATFIAGQPLARREPQLINIPVPLPTIPIVAPVLTPLVGGPNQGGSNQGGPNQGGTSTFTSLRQPTIAPTLSVPAGSFTSLGTGGGGPGRGPNTIQEPTHASDRQSVAHGSTEHATRPTAANALGSGPHLFVSGVSASTKLFVEFPSSQLYPPIPSSTNGVPSKGRGDATVVGGSGTSSTGGSGPSDQRPPGSGGGISKGAIVGIVIVLVALLLGALMLFLRKRAKATQNRHIHHWWFSRKRASGSFDEDRLTYSPQRPQSTTSVFATDLNSPGLSPGRLAEFPHMTDLGRSTVTTPVSFFENRYSGLDERFSTSVSWNNEAPNQIESLPDSPILGETPFPLNFHPVPFIHLEGIASFGGLSQSSTPVTPVSPKNVPSSFFRVSTIPIPPLPPLPTSPPPTPKLYSNPFADNNPFDDPHPT